MTIDLTMKFSIAHHDNCAKPSQYYESIKHSTDSFRKEIYDIYFGKKFRYSYREQEIFDSFSKSHDVTYGNVMGVEATDEQIEYLFKIQQEFNIPISLTINQLNIPVEVFYSKNHRVMNAFLLWLRSYYDKGLRSCTLANNHLMRMGILQTEFPEMIWKNTVNQQVSSAQQVIDYLYLGYNVIQLDRSLNRNLEELKRIKNAVEDYKNEHPDKYVKTCMLVRESCMPSCPFKREHDDLQIFHRKVDYWKTYIGALSCSKWTSKFGITGIPRFGTNCFWLTSESFYEYAALVDIFKFSGRLDHRLFETENGSDSRFAWSSGKHVADSYSEIIENRLEPLYVWGLSAGIFNHLENQPAMIKQDLLAEDFWTTEKARKLEQKLKTCRNQCYNCHLCEDTFGLPSFDSMLQL